MTPNAEAPMQQPSWFSRNWKWLLPVGCLVPMVFCVVMGLGAYVGVSKVIQSSGAYTGAIREVNANPDVAAAIGTPVEAGLGLSGSVNEKNSGGSADFTVPITGSKGEGSLHVVGQRANGQWSYSTIDVTVGGKTIDVLADAQPRDLPDEEPTED